MSNPNPIPFRVSMYYMQPPKVLHPQTHSLTKAVRPDQYTDVSTFKDPIPDTNRNKGGVTEMFPQKLYRMLEETERDGKSDVVSFFSHGRAFAIHKPRRFIDEVMPIFFKQTRLTSFQRQLNLYGFRRISHGRDNGGYYHELFLKGRPGLCVNMKRTRVKGNKADTKQNPDFYTYPPINAHSNYGEGQASPTPTVTRILGGSSPPSIYRLGPYTRAQMFPGSIIQHPRPIPPYTAAQRSAPPAYPSFSSRQMLPQPKPSNSSQKRTSPSKRDGASK